MLKKLWLSLFLSLITLLFYQFWQKKWLEKSGLQICSQVYENFYLHNEELETWYKNCKTIAIKASKKFKKTNYIKAIQSHLANLKTSHVELWSPNEMTRMWKGEGVETGFRALRHESYWFVNEVFENGPSYGVLYLGDEILSINGKVPESLWEVENTEGQFKVWRDGEELNFDITSKKIDYPFQPRLVTLNARKYKAANVGVLKLRSFTPVYFQEDHWINVAQNLNEYDKIIIDLRDNSGGDFIVMQKILSSFLCEQTDIGYLIQPRKKDGENNRFNESMDGFLQIEMIKRSHIVELGTFDAYPCYVGDVVVLMNHGTASTAEIFAKAMQLRPGSKIMGQRSAGAVLLAIWFPTLIGKDYSLSIPVAEYRSWTDQAIEGVGIPPSRLLYYDVAAFRNGLDPWLFQAVN